MNVQVNKYEMGRGYSETATPRCLSEPIYATRAPSLELLMCSSLLYLLSIYHCPPSKTVGVTNLLGPRFYQIFYGSFPTWCSWLVILNIPCETRRRKCKWPLFVQNLGVPPAATG